MGMVLRSCTSLDLSRLETKESIAASKGTGKVLKSNSEKSRESAVNHLVSEIAKDVMKKVRNTTTLETRELRFSVKLYRKEGLLLGSSSDTCNNHLNIELWSGQRIIPKQLGLKGIVAISRNRAEKERLEGEQTLNREIMFTIAAVSCYIMALVFYTFNSDKS